jgi:Uma2 family endonuclease
MAVTAIKQRQSKRIAPGYKRVAAGHTPRSVQTPERYTYTDILAWPEDERWELFDGEAHRMASPTTAHQVILGELFVQLHSFLKGKPCKVYPAPFGVRLFPQPDHSDNTFLEPDIVVVCDSAKIDERGCNGAPDLVIEILSPSSVSRDFIYKLNKYHDAGVREYWIVDPENKLVGAYHFEKTGFKPFDFAKGSKAPVSILPGCEIDLKAVFAE